MAQDVIEAGERENGVEAAETNKKRPQQHQLLAYSIIWVIVWYLRTFGQVLTFDKIIALICF